jgi:hypothetical protein
MARNLTFLFLYSYCTDLKTSFRENASFICLRLERSFVRSQTACFEQVASFFASIWVVEMSPRFVHEMQPSASSEQSDIEPEGMACLQLVSCSQLVLALSSESAVHAATGNLDFEY